MISFRHTCLIVALLLPAIVVAGQEQKLKFAVKETSFGKPQPGTRGDRTVYSADGLHVMWPVQRDGKWLVVIDGKPGPVYEWILLNTLALSREGGHAAFAEQTGDGLRMIVDGKAQKTYVEVSPPAFSRDGARIAYTAKPAGESKGEIVVLDGQESKQYDKVAHRSMVFSRDGKRFAYSAERNGKRFWVVDGQEGKPYEHVTPLEFSRDGSRYGYAGQQGEGFVAVIDGTEGPAYEKIGAFSFSPDNKRTGFVGLRKKRMYAIVDGKEESDHDVVFEPVFSPDSKHVLYIAGNGRSACIVLDGQRQKSYDRLLSVRYSGDGQHLMYLATEGRKQRIVLDGKEGRLYDIIAQVALNDDGSRWAYTAKELDKTVLVINDEEFPGAANMTMSPGDGRYIAHAMEKGNKAVLMVNAAEVATYDAFPAGSRWVFDGPNKLYLMAVRGEELVLVEVTIQEAPNRERNADL